MSDIADLLKAEQPSAEEMRARQPSLEEIQAMQDRHLQGGAQKMAFLSKYWNQAIDAGLPEALANEFTLRFDEEMSGGGRGRPGPRR